ncbi:MAG: cytochrome c biogenesis CcdA family protein [Magnetospiraceae bacterium]
MPGMEVTYFGALTAGLLSFLSPCVLPLVPAYLSFLGGASLEKLTDNDGVDPAIARKVFVAALAFVLGFGTVFVAMGAGATAISVAIRTHFELLSYLGGGIITLFGLHYMGAFRLRFLDVEKRFHLANKPSHPLGSYVLGLAFAFGWTPCVGPILASILFVAATGESITYGIVLLGFYALGIGVPFLIAALGVRPFMRGMARFRRHLHKVEIATGCLLVATGLLIMTGALADIGNWMLDTFPIFQSVG